MEAFNKGIQGLFFLFQIFLVLQNIFLMMKQGVIFVMILFLFNGMVIGQTVSGKGNSQPQIPILPPTVCFANSSPRFPGGNDSLNNFLGKIYKYPELAIKEHIQGKVYLSFVVNADGKISEIKMLKGIGGGCNEEAIRLIKAMPNWIPSELQGKKIPCDYSFMVHFIIDEKNNPSIIFNR